MKKLTAGIFATLAVLVSVGAANANIASTEYVNDKLSYKEDANNKVDALPADPDLNGTVFPTVHLTEQMIQTEVNKVKNAASGSYQTKSGVLDALSQLVAGSDCNTGDGCVVRYNGTTFTLEPITRQEGQSSGGQE